MAQASDNRPGFWAPFAIGAVTMLIVALIWGLWLSRTGVERLIEGMAEATSQLPAIQKPHLPQTPPQLPQPRPIPK